MSADAYRLRRADSRRRATDDARASTLGAGGDGRARGAQGETPEGVKNDDRRSKCADAERARDAATATRARRPRRDDAPPGQRARARRRGGARRSDAMRATAATANARAERAEADLARVTSSHEARLAATLAGDPARLATELRLPRGGEHGVRLVARRPTRRVDREIHGKTGDARRRDERARTPPRRECASARPISTTSHALRRPRGANRAGRNGARVVNVARVSRLSRLCVSHRRERAVRRRVSHALPTRGSPTRRKIGFAAWTPRATSACGVGVEPPAASRGRVPPAADAPSPPPRPWGRCARARRTRERRACRGAAAERARIDVEAESWSGRHTSPRSRPRETRRIRT